MVCAHPSDKYLPAAECKNLVLACWVEIKCHATRVTLAQAPPPPDLRHQSHRHRRLNACTVVNAVTCVDQHGHGFQHQPAASAGARARGCCGRCRFSSVSWRSWFTDANAWPNFNDFADSDTRACLCLSTLFCTYAEGRGSAVKKFG